MNLWEEVEKVKNRLHPFNNTLSFDVQMEAVRDVQQPLPAIRPAPFLRNDELIIPLNAAERYRWWAGGQSILDTLLELDAADSVIEKYIGEITSPHDWRRWQKIRQHRNRAEKIQIDGSMRTGHSKLQTEKK